MTRQREYQKLHKSQGLCLLCGQRAVNASHCSYHREKNRLRMVDRYHRKNPDATFRGDQIPRPDGVLSRKLAGKDIKRPKMKRKPSLTPKG